MQPVLEELQKRRLHARSQALVLLAVLLVVAVGLAIAMGRFFGLLAVVMAPVAIRGWRAANRSLQADYRKYFKANVIARLPRVIDPTLVYSGSSGISQQEFSGSGIFGQRIDRYRAEDLFEGKIGATAFRLSEVHAEHRDTSSSTRGGSRTTWLTIFRGLLFIADFNKDFRGRTFVLPDAAEKALGGVGRLLQGWRTKMDDRQGEIVRLEDAEFEKSFVVSSTDQVEARYLLSPSLMQRLTRFRREVDAPVSLSFVRSRVFIAISTKNDRFEPPSIWGRASLLSPEDVASYFKDVRLSEQIVEDLNLNRRIWSKEP
jgi:hypothetical protein